MGHYASEMCGRTEEDKVFDRTLKLREKIRDVSFTYFSIGDLVLLNKIMQNPDKVYKDELDAFEKKIKLLKLIC